MHTVDAAWMMGEDDAKGSIEPGKLADLIVLERDPFTVPMDDLAHVRTDRAYLGGRLVYERF